MDLPYFIPVQTGLETDRYPLAIILTDDFKVEVGISITGPGAMAWAEEIARRCNQQEES